MKSYFYILVGTLFVCISLFGVGCGSEEQSEQTGAAASAPAAKDGATNDGTAGASANKDGADELQGKPVFHSGKCAGEVGCVRGYISHGTRLVLAPKGAGAGSDARGEPLSSAAYEFNDAQDFGDRFDTAFLMPLVAAEHRQEYDIKVMPAVRRDNFAEGFALYAEGAEANDDRVTMQGEGNFELGDMQSYEHALLRAVKTFRIEIEKNSKADDGTPNIVRRVTCLEIEAVLSDLKIEAGKATKIGGLRELAFYYTESDEICRNLKADGQGTTAQASALPPVGPDLP